MIKKISYERRAYESVEKEPILGMSRKNDEKKNLAHKGLKKMKISKLHWPFNAQDDTGVPLSLKFQFYIKKGSSKKFPMSVAPMSR